MLTQSAADTIVQQLVQHGKTYGTLFILTQYDSSGTTIVTLSKTGPDWLILEARNWFIN